MDTVSDEVGCSDANGHVSVLTNVASGGTTVLAATPPRVTPLIELTAVGTPDRVAVVVSTVVPIPAAIGSPLLTGSDAFAIPELDVAGRPGGET